MDESDLRFMRCLSAMAKHFLTIKDQCSFCGKLVDDCDHLVVSHNASICDTCAKLSAEVIKTEKITESTDA